MNKPALIKKIKNLDTLTNSEKADLIALLNNTKKYGLVWEDKPEDVERELLTMLPVLHEVPEKRILASEIESIDAKIEEVKKSNSGDGTLSIFPDEAIPIDEASATSKELSPAPNHILIEGDNLHALTALTFTHEGCIDLIYIDPPYNTGNKDFKYNDSFVDREDTYRHSKWLSFIHKRLEIALRLLSEDGAIFISIDDNENAQLKLLCDEVFQENFICSIIWQKIDSPKNSAKYFSDDHEYVICYAKNKNKWRPKLIRRNEEMIARYKNPDKDPRGPWLLGDLAARNFYGAGRYAITTPSGRIIDGPPAGSYWRVSEDKFNSLFSDNRIWFGDKGENRPGIKRFLSEVRQGVIPQTLWTWQEVGSTRNSKQEFSQLMAYSANDDLFVTPKPVKLISRIAQIGTNHSSVILDFFAGSGTTLHATMSLNAEDGGRRQCIMVTNNENNICEEVTYERNRRVMEGYSNTKGIRVPGLTNNNLRYFKTGFVPSTKTEANRRLLTNASTELLQIKEDCYSDITISNGFDPSKCCIYTNGLGKYLIIVFYSRKQHDVIEQLCLFIKNISDLTTKVRVYGFSPETEVLVEDFYSVADKINAVPLPDAIYNAYRATFKTLKLDRKNFSISAPESVDGNDQEGSETDSQPELFDQSEGAQP